MRKYGLLTTIFILLLFASAVPYARAVEPPKTPVSMFGQPTTFCVPVAGKHCVDVWWDASTTSGVTYNLFRGTVNPGTATTCTGVKIISGITSLNVVDSNPTNGATYYYQVNAQDTGGNQSACTLAVQVQIPVFIGAPTNPSASVQ